MASPIVFNPAAADYKAAQQPELEALKNSGQYSIWQWMKDAPAVGLAKFNVMRSSEGTDGYGRVPNDILSQQMDDMRALAKYQHDHPWQKKESADAVNVQSQWNDLDRGKVWMRMPPPNGK